MNVADAGANFTGVIRAVHDTQEPLIVEDDGERLAVLISPEDYDGYEQYVMSRFNAAVDELRRRNADNDPDEVFRDLSAIVEDVRQEQYEREQCEP